MNNELKSNANKLIFPSWFKFYSNPPNPSVSRTKHLTDGSSGCGIRYGHIQIPLVHAFTVDPTLNPF